MKMRRLSSLGAMLTMAMGLVALSACCTPALISSLPVTPHPQETGMWCWAASGQMVMDFLGNNVAQCTQANNRFGVTNCPCSQCTSPIPGPPCVNGGWPELEKYGFTYQRTSNTALTWEQLRSEIDCHKRPVAFSWHWNGGGGHMMVANGYVTVAGVNYVSILDPWAPCAGDARIIPYTEYVAGAGYTHWDDFYQIVKN